MDNFNSGKIKEMVYDVLQNPTRENFIDILDNGLGEQDTVYHHSKLCIVKLVIIIPV